LATARARCAATAATALLPHVIGQEQAGEDRKDHHRVLEATEHELMDAGDIEDDRTDDDQAEGPEARQDEEQATHNLEDFHKLEVAGAFHGADEGRSWGTFGRVRDGDEVEEEVKSEDDEDRAEEDGDDIGGEFHDALLAGREGGRPEGEDEKDEAEAGEEDVDE